ncbi:tetratricopeptide repeat protein [Pinirhizobacter soli]|uniref:tetratricopeptide repeat protein n=1 Tax=Pinirhizobacter soli TaxID=2786953 RepID=UPI00202A8D89|nr:DUF4034 domain-containing protein [Pinirhizobacter soli]
MNAARQAEAVADPLQRCLKYPDPPTLDWPKATIAAYCQYQFDPAVTPKDVQRLIQSGHAAELDKRLSKVMDEQLSQPGAQGKLDRTYNLDFKNGSEEFRALMDSWKRQSPTSPFALAASGTAYVQMAQQARGSNSASKTSHDSFQSMGQLLELARADLDRAVALQPKLTAAYGAMITAATLGSDKAYASSAAERGLAVDPSNYGIYARLVWMAQPKWGGEIEDMQRLIASAQRQADKNPLMKLLVSQASGGEEYVESCDCSPADVVKIYRQVFAEGATVNMLMSAGWGAKKQNLSVLSVIYRSEVLRFAPDQMAQREGRAYDLPTMGQPEWAIEEGNALVAIAPQDENAFDVRGYAYQSTGNFVRAVDDYQEALRLNPSDAWTLSTLGNLYIRSAHDWDKGWSMADRLIQLHPDDPQGWLLRATIQKGQPRDGLDQTISDFVARFGNDPSQQGAVAQMRAMRSP